ncbi:MAG: YdeI/OmpD-associated family protein [Cyanobacteria bacterium P01_D01_bin.123]
MADVPANSYQPSSRADWRAWLDANHVREEGIWVVNYKKASGKQAFTFDEAVEEALCFGWIDSKPSKLDADRSMLWFAPRKSGSGWSRLNKTRVEKAIANGQMTPAGAAKIEAAKQDGAWYVLDAIEDLIIPPDLAAAFEEYPSASQNFEAFPRSAKRGILEWIFTAKKPETRAKRIAETARLAEDNIRANQWRK